MKVVTVRRILVQEYTLPFNDWANEDESPMTPEQIQEFEGNQDVDTVISELVASPDLEGEVKIESVTTTVAEISNEDFMTMFGESDNGVESSSESQGTDSGS